MNISNINEATRWFEVLQTTDSSQTAVMRLGPGEASRKQAEAHEESEQILFVVEGGVAAEVGSERFRMTAGDIVVIPPGVKHKFSNPGPAIAVTFNVYCPPEYPP
jgi:mannose-6-phosphate isomerase-like protein (cupin superfamily)